MNWAWKQKLRPTPKLILMSLADAADDFGICWPSVPTVADKCCVSIRTVRRVMKKLEERRLMLSEPRYRKDGSCTSNRYRLQINGGDRLSPAPDPDDTTSGQPCQGPPDAGGIPGTTIGTQKEPLQPLEAETGAAVSRSVESGSGETIDLIYPNTLSAKEREEAGKKLIGIPAELAQQLLDELAACIGTNVIRKTPLAYLRGLIARARAGTFTPEGALRIVEQRRQRAEVDAALQRSEPPCDGPQQTEIDPDNPLVRRLLDIQSRLQEKKCQSD